jgi:mannose-1-phosphate guanylyltransferase/mannose-6-phosphate isomerase
LEKRQSIDIPLQAKHSLQNHTNEPLKILEVQKGDYISEDDIIRYEDMYGRVK